MMKIARLLLLVYAAWSGVMFWIFTFNISQNFGGIENSTDILVYQIMFSNPAGISGASISFLLIAKEFFIERTRERVLMNAGAAIVFNALVIFLAAAFAGRVSGIELSLTG